MALHPGFSPTDIVHVDPARFDLGAIKVFIPNGNPILVDNDSRLSADVRAWLDQNVGPQYSSIRALFRDLQWPGYVAIRASETQVWRSGGNRGSLGRFHIGWDFFFRSTRHALLFKLTWV